MWERRKDEKNEGKEKKMRWIEKIWKKKTLGKEDREEKQGGQREEKLRKSFFNVEGKEKRWRRMHLKKEKRWKGEEKKRKDVYIWFIHRINILFRMKWNEINEKGEKKKKE